MIGVYAAFAFAGGAILGSFLSVVAHRVPRGETFVTGRSRCPRCGARIGARDNIPIVSWLLLRGRCRACGSPISPRYPLVELGLGIAFAAAVLVHGDDQTGLATGPDEGGIALALVLLCVLAVVTLTDLDLRLIPNVIMLPAAVVAIAIVAALLTDQLDEHLIAAAIAGGIFFAIAFAAPRGMGMGDAKLVAVMGLYLGRAVAPAVLIGLLAGSVVGMGIIARQGAGARKQAVPFGPFLALGGVIALFVGEDIVEWYLDNFA